MGGWGGGGLQVSLIDRRNRSQRLVLKGLAPVGRFQHFLHLWVRGPRVWGSSGEEEDPSSGEEPACSSSSGE